MKRLFILIIILFATCNIAAAQFPLAELRKAREIKILESTKDDAMKILANGSLIVSDYSNSSRLYFSMMDANIMISYSSGNCAEKNQDWNVSKYLITEIDVRPKDKILIQNAEADFLEEIGIDISKLRKERNYGKTKGRYIYHNKSAGIAIYTRHDTIESITFFPSKKNYPRLCGREEVKRFYSSVKMNRSPENKYTIFDYNDWANVVALDLDRTEITVGCEVSNAGQSEILADDANKIQISTAAADSENDVLTFSYFVSAGKIIGQGAKVAWDLSGVKVGIYKVTAAVDDGCGICGKYITKTVVVKECPSFPAK